ncbi:DUF86 domain-containing protein, partial [Leptospira sp. 201903071]|uniref:HepT-like ribonuclease domain-containing protein n=1 Tax=Leptospira ainazelensis TaxID=2810034 RepID=UPI00196414AB|nr:DUF86 domain-containing protein [Leptospira ainazelensis]
MPRDVAVLLDDLLISLKEISQFLEGISSLEQYKADILRKRAVERNLEVIGEVAKKIP